MTKNSTQNRLIQSGIAVLALAPFIAYFGSKALVGNTCNSEAVWSVCSLGEIPVGLMIGLGLFIVATILFTVGTLGKK